MEHPTPETAVFEYINRYPFDEDTVFKEGLAQILQRPEATTIEKELDREDDIILQAKCFYIAKIKNLEPAPDPAMFKEWLASKKNLPQSTSAPNAPASSQQAEAQTLESNSDLRTYEPSYPSSFADIVELISTGKPIPGIQHVPDTVLTGHGSISKESIRLKPWETAMSPKDDENKAAKVDESRDILNI